MESVRAGLVFALKQAVGTDAIQAAEEHHWQYALGHWDRDPALQILGSHDARRLSIVSFRVRHGDRAYLHHNYVVALLNDLFGVQARGGCSCAGPCGHRLPAINADTSHNLSDEVVHGCDGIKPGWVRVNFDYFISDTVRDHLVDAVDLIARYGHRLLPDYRFDPRTGRWRHHRGPTDPPLRLTNVRWTPDGDLTILAPRHHRLGEETRPAQLAAARALFSTRPDHLDNRPPDLPPDFERKRWFALPPACLEGARPVDS